MLKNITDFIKDNPWIIKLFFSILTLIIGSLLYTYINHLFKVKIEKKSGLFSGKKTKTYIKLLKSINKYIFFIIILSIILNINGINISSLLTSIGILSIIIGFAVQDALKDIIRGINIVSDSYYQVGDVIKFDDITGKVLSVGIITTKVEDIYTLNTVSISNRNIEKVEIISRLINIDIPLPYDLKINEAKDVINYITDKISKIKNVEEVKYHGVNELAESSIKYQIKVYCSPLVKVQTRRDCLSSIVESLEEKNIAIPFNQLDIHQK